MGGLAPAVRNACLAVDLTVVVVRRTFAPDEMIEVIVDMSGLPRMQRCRAAAHTHAHDRGAISTPCNNARAARVGERESMRRERPQACAMYILRRDGESSSSGPHARAHNRGAVSTPCNSARATRVGEGKSMHGERPQACHFGCATIFNAFVNPSICNLSSSSRDRWSRKIALPVAAAASSADAAHKESVSRTPSATPSKRGVTLRCGVCRRDARADERLHALVELSEAKVEGFCGLACVSARAATLYATKRMAARRRRPESIEIASTPDCFCHT